MDILLINPATGNKAQFFQFHVPTDTVVIFVGGRATGVGQVDPFHPSDSARAAPGDIRAFGPLDFVKAAYCRGQEPCRTNAATDFGPWGGHISFNSDRPFHAEPTPVPPGKIDLYSVALHEIMHVLGFSRGTPGFDHKRFVDSFERLINGTTFLGPNSIAEYDRPGNGVRLAEATDENGVRLGYATDHWEFATEDDSCLCVTTPTSPIGFRKPLTRLDLAGLDDIGWEVLYPPAPTCTHPPLGSPLSPVDNGDFESGDFRSWMIAGVAGGTAQIIQTADGHVAELTAGSPVSVSQAIRTPALLIEGPVQPFVISFDYTFTTLTGNLQVLLNNELLATIAAPSALANGLIHTSIEISDLNLFSLVDVPLAFTLDGPTGSQVLIDNVSRFVAPPGDHNNDGIVDAADYVVWRKNDGSQEGYDIWRANFGTISGSGSSLNAPATSPAVLEPTALALIILATIVGRAVRRPIYCRQG